MNINTDIYWLTCAKRLTKGNDGLVLINDKVLISSTIISTCTVPVCYAHQGLQQILQETIHVIHSTHPPSNAHLSEI